MQRKGISLIAAMDENRLIGKGSGLPWHLPNDLKHFKAHTLDKTIVMGRKTWDTLGKPLPRREHWVLTRDSAFKPAGCRVFSSLESVLQAHAEGELMVVGGGEIYKLFLPVADRFYLTEVHAQLQGDAWFPPFDRGRFTELSRADHSADEQHAQPYSFVTLEQRQILA